MAIISTAQIVGSEGSQDREYVYEFKRVYQVISDARNDDEYTILNLAAIPTMYSAHSGNTNAKVVGKRAVMTQDSRGYVWHVEITYSTKYRTVVENPLLRPALFDFGFAQHSEPYRIDANDEKVDNSAGTFYDPLPEKDASRLHFTVTKNTVTYDVAMAIAYQDVLNASAWAGFALKTVKCNNIRGRGPLFENGYTFYETVFEFEFRREGWKDKLPDVGYYYLSGSARIQFTDNAGQPLPRPQTLDGSGGAGSATVIYNEFEPYPTKNFAALGLI
jgi:hypothetical protein